MLGLVELAADQILLELGLIVLDALISGCASLLQELLLVHDGILLVMLLVTVVILF